MIVVSVRLREDGCLAELEARGHAPKDFGGTSLVCGAASFMLRTAGDLFISEKDLGARVNLPEEGLMVVKIDDVPDGLRERMKGMTDFLVYGLIRLSREHPGELDIKLKGEAYGT